MNILVLGATSRILQETLKLIVKPNSHCLLIGRDPVRTKEFEASLRRLGALQVESETADLDILERHQDLIDGAWKKLKYVDLVLMGHGVFFNQKKMENFEQNPTALYATNLLSPVSLLLRIANKIETQKSGKIAVISSVAGDYGRQTNYIYGSAKGGLSIFLQGYRARLYRSGVQVVTIKPGPVRTGMTKNLGELPFMIEAEAAGKIIAKGLLRNRDVIYVPRFFFAVMFILKILPERWIKRLSF